MRRILGGFYFSATVGSAHSPAQSGDEPRGGVRGNTQDIMKYNGNITQTGEAYINIIGNENYI